MKIAVLAGGLSPERDVSLSSGSLISNALIRNGHSVALADVYLGIEGQPPFDALFSTTPDYSYEIPDREPDLEVLRSKCPSGELIGNNIIELCRESDAVFIALHGGSGENGQIQAALDCAGITAYTGSGYSGCLLAMDKNISKLLCASAGVPTAQWIMFDTAADDISRIEREIGIPCVVKPCGCGSSVGVSVVSDRNELEKAIALAAKYEDKVLVEKKISGREFSVGILDGKALPPIEIIPINGWYDYKNKYQGGCTREIVPAELTPEQTKRVGELSLTAHRALGLGVYSRSDFILDSESGEFMWLEANALPGMTPNSLLPQEAAAAGIGYDELCDILVSKCIMQNY